MNNISIKNKLLQMKGFCAVIEEGTILAASQKLNTAHSNVSIQISTLERDLNLNLFRREKQKLIPTSEALRLYKIMKKSLLDIDKIFNNTLTSIKSDRSNTVTLAAQSYVLSHILPSYCRQIIEMNSNVKFNLHNMHIEEAVDMLEHGLIDFAVYSLAQDSFPEMIEKTKFYRCKFGIVAAKNHPITQVKNQDITWELISNYDFITPGATVTAQCIKSVIKDHGLYSRFTLNSANCEICMGYIKEGLSISGADEKYFKWHHDVVFKECNHLLPVYQFYILTNKKAEISSASAKLLELMKP